MGLGRKRRWWRQRIKKKCGEKCSAEHGGERPGRMERESREPPHDHPGKWPADQSKGIDFILFVLLFICKAGVSVLFLPRASDKNLS